MTVFLLTLVMTFTAAGQDPEAATSDETTPATPAPDSGAAPEVPEQPVAPASPPVAAQPAEAPATPAAEPTATSPSATEEEEFTFVTPSDDTQGAGSGEIGSEDSASFALALQDLQSKVTWTGYGDFTIASTKDKLVFDAAHFNPIMGAALSNKLWAEVELEFEHGGSEIKVEYGILDYRFGSGATLRLGQFLIPIGQFNELLHPSFRWTQVSRPGMFRSVIPSVWSDVGMQLFGGTDAGAFAFGYNAYVINGLGSADPEAKPFNVNASEPLRKLRENRTDTNTDKGVGGQIKLQAGRGATVGDTTLRLSGYSGATTVNNKNRVSIADVALDSKLGPVRVLAEAAQSFLVDQPYERGFYGMVSGKVEKTTLSTRFDHVTTAMHTSTPETTNKAVATVMYAPYSLWNLRTEVAVPVGETETIPTYYAMSAFYF